MSLHWYACISTNTYRFEMHHIPLETDWWALSNTSSITWIRSAVIEILADEAFTAIDGLISQSFVVTFVHPAHMRIALIWGFPAQLSLWKSVYWLWRYKLNEVCDRVTTGKLSFKRLPSLKLPVAFPALIPEGKTSTMSWDDQVSAKEDRDLVFRLETALQATQRPQAPMFGPFNMIHGSAESAPQLGRECDVTVT